jgi:hypothetical protein
LLFDFDETRAEEMKAQGEKEKPSDGKTQFSGIWQVV